MQRETWTRRTLIQHAVYACARSLMPGRDSFRRPLLSRAAAALRWGRGVFSLPP
jgi:hypothetical protein